MFVPNREAGYPATNEAFSSRYPQASDYAVTPAGIQRNVQLASALEPLVFSPEKTTRQADCHPGQRFAFFVTAGVNIGESFRALGERLVQARTENATSQPLLYDTALAAQIDSKRQRDGGRTNHGIISMLVPLVASQVLYLERTPDPDNIDDVFANLGRVMASTTIADVRAVQQMENLAFEMSGWTDRLREEELYSGQTVLEYYEAKRDGTGRAMYAELASGQPRTQDILAEVLEPRKEIDPDQGFQDIFSAACHRVLDGLPSSYHPQLLADNTAAALYVVLSHFSEEEIIF